MAAKTVKTSMIRIKLKAYDFKILDESAKLIVDVLTKNGASFRDLSRSLQTRKSLRFCVHHT